MVSGPRFSPRPSCSACGGCGGARLSWRVCPASGFTRVRHWGVSVLLITGDDESILLEELGTRIHEALGGADRSLVLDDFDLDRPTIDEREQVVRSVVDAAATVALFSDYRVVVVRNIGKATVDTLAPLVDYLANPLDSTRLILTASGKLAKSVADAIKKAGGTTVSTSVGTDAKQREMWFREQLEAAGLRLDPAAIAAISERLGADVGRFPGLIDTLVSTFGTSKKLSRDDVVPFLGEAGSVSMFKLSDAIDAGNVSLALEVLHRLAGAGEMHAMQLLKFLHTHFSKMLRLDGADVSSHFDAMEILGAKSEYPAKKAMEQLNRLGSDGVRDALQLLADADVHLRGGRDWPDILVMEVLVARLAKLSARRGRPTPLRR
ncbi:MAG: DNA polymerase III subunit delta [Ilumatobacteraceae bacterium]|nr:DNA polymerase III subunit delta [Ilumatobacteraceae bacterium]